MPTGIRIEGLARTLAALTRMQADARKNGNARLAVGYSAPYALHVHEDLEAFHPNGGNAKYLSGPARREREAMKRIVAARLKRKRGLKEAIRAAGEHLLKKSREEVPVDTKFLYNSGFVKVTDADGNEV